MWVVGTSSDHDLDVREVRKVRELALQYRLDDSSDCCHVLSKMREIGLRSVALQEEKAGLQQ